jgi:hypothetical protein
MLILGKLCTKQQINGWDDGGDNGYDYDHSTTWERKIYIPSNALKILVFRQFQIGSLQ